MPHNHCQPSIRREINRLIHQNSAWCLGHSARGKFLMENVNDIFDIDLFMSLTFKRIMTRCPRLSCAEICEFIFFFDVWEWSATHISTQKTRGIEFSHKEKSFWKNSFIHHYRKWRIGITQNIASVFIDYSSGTDLLLDFYSIFPGLVRKCRSK